MKLQNVAQSRDIISDLKIADSFVSRGIGLLNRKHLSENEGIWIKSCSSIHTFFMKFAIDCVFVDKNLVVKSLHKKVVPWRLIWPIWGAHSVFELPSGVIEKYQIKVGDQLNVSD